MDIADLMIHVNEAPSPEQRASIEEALRGVDGVVSSHFSPDQEQLLLVAFDPGKTDPRELLERVKAAGFTGQLVGL
ncbi:MAG TPA: heavy metal-associated domain-containing protein [Pelomicrobium sp.]|nr:heavy metal-associated domain-containing protein [Pelomicrobium sp.]